MTAVLRHNRRLQLAILDLFCLTATAVFATPTASAQVAPVINAVANAASYSRGSVSPGEMVVLFGTLLGPSQLAHLEIDASGKLSTSIANVQVYFGGFPAPLVYVSATQIAAMVPYEVASSSSTQVVVHYQGLVSQAYTVAVAPTAPGIFSANASGQGPVAASNAIGSVNSATNPAAPGSYVTFYLTGEGQLAVPGSDGTIAAAADQVGLQVALTIGGLPAQVMYAGAAPGNTNGFAQINAVVPASLQTGGPLPLVVQVGSAASQSGLTVYVSGPAGPVILAAPTNLQASLLSSTTGNLTWVNNAPTATAIRVEASIGGGAFQDVGASNTLTSANLTGLAAGTSYTFRVRAQNGQVYSGYSNTAGIIAPQQQSRRTVLMIHGTSQSSADIQPFARNLQTYLNPLFLTVDSSFDFGDCKSSSCPSNCTIPLIAQRLASYIQTNVPAGHIELVGYSLGGLIVREMILNQSGILSQHPVDALVTVATPNLGYPYEQIDNSMACPSLIQQMNSNYRDSRGFVWSSYLNDLNEKWIAKPLASGPLAWLAIAGTSCANPDRIDDILQHADVNTGCRNANILNDNVVCQDSALFNVSSISLPAVNAPTAQLSTPFYSHTNVATLGGWGFLGELIGIDSLFAQCNWTRTGSLGDPGADVLQPIANFLASH